MQQNFRSERFLKVHLKSSSRVLVQLQILFLKNSIYDMLYKYRSEFMKFTILSCLGEMWTLDKCCKLNVKIYIIVNCLKCGYVNLKF